MSAERMYLLVEINGPDDAALRRGNKVLREAIHRVAEEAEDSGELWRESDVPVWSEGSFYLPPTAFSTVRAIFARVHEAVRHMKETVQS